MKDCKFKILTLFCVLIIASVFLNSCTDSPNTPTTQGSNIVKGYVKSANGSVAVQGVRVILSTVIDLIDTAFTNASGYYTFDTVANGNYKLLFTKGSFRDSVNITVPIAGNVPDARLVSSKPIAFYWGEYDEIQIIIRQMGYQLDSLTLADFDNLTKLNTYSIIFVNCGGSSRDELNTPSISANLTSFLNGGRRMYASDWAFGCVQGIHPELQGTYSGNSQDSVQATVTYSSLATYLGKSVVPINYNLGSWLELSPSNNELVNIPFLKATHGTFTNNCIAFYRNEGTNSGKLIYTTFHNEAQVTSDMIKILQFFFFEL